MNNVFVRSIRLEEEIPEYSYLNDIPAVTKLKELDMSFNNPVTMLIGENGAGKSTIIEALAINLGFNPEGGTKNYSFSTNDTHSELSDYITVAKTNYFKRGYFLRAESFYNTLTYSDAVFKRTNTAMSSHNQSHGESFLEVARNEFQPNSFYILDEPEAALSPTRMMQLLCIIHDAVEGGAQFVIATHSPILMSYPNATIYELNEYGFKETNYKDTDHYRVTKDFIDKPEIMYKHLFG